MMHGAKAMGIWAILCSPYCSMYKFWSYVALVDWTHVPLGLAPGQKLSKDFLDLPEYLNDESAASTINNGAYVVLSYLCVGVNHLSIFRITKLTPESFCKHTPFEVTCRSITYYKKRTF